VTRDEAKKRAIGVHEGAITVNHIRGRIVSGGALKLVKSAGEIEFVCIQPTYELRRSTGESQVQCVRLPIIPLHV
jgi:hypothetical protein